MGVGQDARAFGPALRLGDLWRGRLDPRADPRDRGADRPRNLDPGRRASDLRRRHPRRGGRDRARPIGKSACAISSRSAATRPSRARNSRRTPADMPMPPSWSPASSRWRRSRFRLPPFPNAIRIRRTSPPISTISSARSMPARTGRRPNSSSIRLLLPLPGPGGGGRDRRGNPARHHAGHQFRRDQPDGGDERHLGPRLGRPAVRGAGRSSRRPPAGRRHGRGGAVRAALCGRRAPLPFLHVQPGRAELRDLPPARREGQSA